MLRLLSLGITSMIPIFLTSHYMVRSLKVELWYALIGGKE